jgi:hypothetical protein
MAKTRDEHTIIQGKDAYTDSPLLKRVLSVRPLLNALAECRLCEET